MTKVLVPIDGSEPAMRALRHAMATADEIHIVNVQQKADTPTLLLHMTQDAIDRAQQEHGRSILNEAIKRLDSEGRRYFTHVVIGEPARSIVRVAEAEGVDSIVMGTRGMSALANLTLGSIATKVIHLSELPVTLVR